LGVRQWWSASVTAELAAAVFFAMRVSDAYSQIAYLALAPSERLFGSSGTRLETVGIRIKVLVLATFSTVFAAVGLSLFGLEQWKEAVSLPVFAIAGQAIADVVRIPASIFNIGMVRAARPGGAALLVAPLLSPCYSRFGSRCQSCRVLLYSQGKQPMLS